MDKLSSLMWHWRCAAYNVNDDEDDNDDDDDDDDNNC